MVAVLCLSLLSSLTAAASVSDGYVFVTKWGESGAGPSQFQTPLGIDVDSNGDVYVADTFNGRVQIFSTNGDFLSQIGSFCNKFVPEGCIDPDGDGPLGLGDGQFIEPKDVAVDSFGNVYVSDHFVSAVIQKFDENHNLALKWGTYCDMRTGELCVDPDGPGPLESGDAQFNQPLGLAIDSQNFVYVADAGNTRIQKFDSNGNFVTKWGFEGSGNGAFSFPHGIAIDSSDRIFVVDSNLIQVFDTNGSFESQFGSSCSLETGEGCVDPDGDGPLQLGDGQFGSAYHIDFDSSDNIFVADAGNFRVVELTNEGDFVANIGGGSGPCDVRDGVNFGCIDPDDDGPLEVGDGQFALVYGIAIGSQDRLFVGDFVNDRIQAFDRNIAPASIEEIIEEVRQMEIPKGLEKSMVAPLKQALKIINDDNPSNDNGACGKIKAFMKMVDSKEKAGKLTSEQASLLQGMSEEVLTNLGCHQR